MVTVAAVSDYASRFQATTTFGSPTHGTYTKILSLLLQELSSVHGVCLQPKSPVIPLHGHFPKKGAQSQGQAKISSNHMDSSQTIQLSENPYICQSKMIDQISALDMLEHFQELSTLFDSCSQSKTGRSSTSQSTSRTQKNRVYSMSPGAMAARRLRKISQKNSDCID
jgi:hypothetical protein